MKTAIIALFFMYGALLTGCGGKNSFSGGASQATPANAATQEATSTDTVTSAATDTNGGVNTGSTGEVAGTNLIINGTPTTNNGPFPDSDGITPLINKAMPPDKAVDVGALNKPLRDDGGPTGGTVTTKDGEDFAQNFTLGCDENKEVDLQIPGTDKARVATTIRGQFCPEEKKALSLVFVVDNSGSMGKHRDSGAAQDSAGNDPQTTDASGAATCGRLKAARSVIAMLQGDSFKDVAITMQVISFASDVIANKQLKAAGDALNSKLVTDKIFCETVIQGPSYAQPGGISPSGIVASTNYQAPLQAAEAYLKGLGGKSLIYFITDGNPNVPGNESQGIQAGIDAGTHLRATIPDLVFNAVFLAATNPDQAKSILAQVAGDASHVLLASDASELEKKIVEFPAISFAPSDAKANLTVAPYPAEPLGIAVVADPSKANIWDYQTQPFVLQYKDGETVDNVVTISAKANDGQVYKASITIHVK